MQAINSVVDTELVTSLKGSGFPRLFAEAEAAIKEVELEQAELIIPAVNELRYAGYHISKYINEPEAIDELDRAIGHCKRARYDAYEAGIIYYHREFSMFCKDYKTVVITEVLPEYIKYHQEVENAKKFIKETDKETKDIYYQQCSEIFKTMIRISKEIAIAREELNKLLKKERRQSFIAIFTAALTALALVFSVYSFFNSNKNQSGVESSSKTQTKTNSSPNASTTNRL